MAGGIGIGAAIEYFVADHGGALGLERAEPLTIESGDAEYWSGATLDEVRFEGAGHDADLVVRTRSARMTRHMPYRDAAHGAKHFAFDDASTGTHAELSVDTHTREFFYAERGVADGRPYAVKSHGWLRPDSKTTLDASASADTAQTTAH
ncbi:hypothetical protein [Pararobbsia silviterrae]|uniref:hypothetical protein n=1 Tax=Pararobbsia silviterrae TaxID=1792498 RepID=UPI00131454E0|nr:hypothetical protein [Pararobbsia silviterrae]